MTSEGFNPKGKAMADVVLETEHLSMHFGGVAALVNVSLKLRRNELRCLIGPNGAGKTTFFRCVSGQYLPTSGDVWVAGERTTGLQVHALARRGVGLKTQVPSLMNALTTSENLWLGANAVAGRSRAQIKHAVDTVVQDLGLADFLSRPVGLLSHGKRQLVELGVVLGAQPWLLLLDEPAGGLTHDEVDHMAALMLRLRERMTIMVVEHDMSFVRQLDSEVTVFHQGAVLTEGPAAKVLADERVRAVYLGKKAV